MRIAAVVAVFIVLCAAALVGVVAPASGQTIPPTATVTETPTPTPCAIDCGPVPTQRPPSDSTPDPGCTGECNPVPTPRPTDGAPMTPAPGCEGVCFPFPTPRPTIDPDDAIGPAQPDTGPGIWHYEFMPVLHR